MSSNKDIGTILLARGIQICGKNVKTYLPSGILVGGLYFDEGSRTQVEVDVRSIYLVTFKHDRESEEYANKRNEIVDMLKQYVRLDR